jgi:hypothetical protein
MYAASTLSTDASIHADVTNKEQTKRIGHCRSNKKIHSSELVAIFRGNYSEWEETGQMQYCLLQYEKTVPAT